ncbi:4-hydroxy-tetrahydrodipicolinate synthase [Luteimonas cucumeris]|uniref:4-hydroxy-tetrahydrodipicolinate synthase n=1 Tax=Luteimonas cucumeris TaxID=985012 RepID=A0A562LBJ6_9GAMM|nr:dihydrodipicolinate synthase family protein [Luteimonas cucumeris]TWI04988.1 4-hydroxy-tetrahydrodipicolinate synthase [Luteimonas cucumeris]
MGSSSCTWSGIIPAVTTQFAADMAVDIDATQRVQDALVRDGVHGLIVCGTCGENNSLEPDEKLAVVAAAVEASAGRVPIIVGTSEFTTPRAVNFARAVERLGASGLMVLPAMVYVPTEAELLEHFRTVANSTALPVMLYNNPPAYRVSVTMKTLEGLAAVPNVVAIKESAPDPRRFTDLHNAFGDRYALFAGLDDVALEGLLLGAQGWVSGLTSAFPQESIALWDALQRGDLPTALAIYRWFMPLLHLDADHDLVQSIKLAEQIMGRGSERVRMPRMPLTGARRAQVVQMVETAAATRPTLVAAAA